MRTYFYIFICVFSAIILNSCEKESYTDIPSNIALERVGSLLDGGSISNVKLYCVETPIPIGSSGYQYYESTKTVEDYSKFYMYIIINKTVPDSIYSDSDDADAIREIELEYEHSKSLFLVDEYNQKIQDFKEEVSWPYIYTAYINGEVAITCDKTLFGLQPGENICKYFDVKTPNECLPIGIDNPKLVYTFGENAPVNPEKVFGQETWLQFDYYLSFRTMPSEKYEDITLYLSIPIKKEHIRKYAIEKFRDENTEKIFTTAILTAECTIKFNWK